MFDWIVQRYDTAGDSTRNSASDFFVAITNGNFFRIKTNDPLSTQINSTCVLPDNETAVEAMIKNGMDVNYVEKVRFGATPLFIGAAFGIYLIMLDSHFSEIIFFKA